jgi:HSF-type DNA-binding
MMDNSTSNSKANNTGTNINGTAYLDDHLNLSIEKREKDIDKNGDLGSDDDDGTETNDPNNPNGQHHPIAEFLYQLTKMLTDDNNEIIEWTDGRIKVHYPERLEGEVLHKYFRHSKFASFQRQLNYFGFRKIAGKGKMSPCSYVNEDATSDIRSLLLIKRKTNGSAARKAALQQRVAAMTNSTTSMMNPFALPQALTPVGGLNFPGFNLNPNLLGGGATADQQQALINAVALLAQSGIATMPNFANNNMMLAQPQAPPQQARNNVDLQQLNLLNLQHQHQLLQKQLLTQQQQAQQNQAALKLLQSHQVTNVKPPSQVTSSFGDNINQDMNTQFGNGGVANNATLEQLQAQLKALTQQQQQLQQQKNQQLQQQQQQQQPSSSSGGTGNAFTALLNQVAANQVAAAAAASTNNPSLNLATAALNAQQGNASGSAGMQQPATAAMNASIQSNTNSTNLFDSAINLKSLLDEHKAQTEQQQQQQQLQQSAAAQALFNRLPSQSGIFHGNDSGTNNNMSTISFTQQLLGVS